MLKTDTIKQAQPRKHQNTFSSGRTKGGASSKRKEEKKNLKN